MSTMNEEQQLAHDQIVNYITTTAPSEHRMLTLSGYAGTGKSYTLSEVVRTLKRIGWFEEHALAMTAPTHKAVRVLKRFSSKMPDVAFATIHSLLGLKETHDNNGKIKFVQSKDPHQIKIDSFDAILLDEASMLHDELTRLLIPYAVRGLKLIFIGDRAQLPPVGLPDSIPFLEPMQAQHKIGVVALKTIVRQAMDNPILALATHIRDNYNTLTYIQPVGHVLENGDGIIVFGQTKRDELLIHEVIRTYFACEAFKQDADYMKIIAWTNRTVNDFNKIVRAFIFPGLDPVPYLMEGEKMIVDKPILMANNRILLSANEEVVVQRFEERTETVDYVISEMGELIQKSYDFTCYLTWVTHFDSDGLEEMVQIRILHEKEHAKMASVLKAIADTANGLLYTSPARNAMWRLWFAVERKFAAMKYNYAVTAHKSQGSSYDNCMVVDWDIAQNKDISERNRCRYVAVTRPRHKLFIIK